MLQQFDIVYGLCSCARVWVHGVNVIFVCCVLLERSVFHLIDVYHENNPLTHHLTTPFTYNSLRPPLQQLTRAGSIECYNTDRPEFLSVWVGFLRRATFL